MDCEKIRDRFSSLWEKELTPFEEKMVKGHLSSCPECQSEFEQFKKTMRWLHSVGEVEVPDGFLPGIYKKMEERKRTRSAEKSRKSWLNFPLPLKLPVQALAMVAIVFLVLYLTKMMPQPPAPLSAGKKPEQTLAQKEEPTTPQVKAATKRAEAPSPKTEVLAFKQMESKDAAKAAAPSPGAEKIEKELFAKKKPVASAKLPQEIVLKTSDRERAILKVQELVKQFGGEMLTTKGYGFLASLPKDSFSDFEKELQGVGSGDKTDKRIMREKSTGGLRALHEAKKEAVEVESGEPAKSATDEEGRIVVRILLIQE